jgi:hypothetical protein
MFICSLKEQALINRFSEQGTALDYNQYPHSDCGTVYVFAQANGKTKTFCDTHDGIEFVNIHFDEYQAQNSPAADSFYSWASFFRVRFHL